MGTVNRPTILATTIVALTLALIVDCGCSEQDQEVRKALGEANAHLKRFGEYIEDLKGLQKSLESVAEQPSTENTPEVKEILAAERKDEEAAHNEVKEAERSPKSAGELRVSKDMKVVIGMEASVFEEQEQALASELEATDLKSGNIDMIMVGAPFDAALVQLLRSINELEVVSRQHFAKAAELHKKANDYYENKKLGK